MFLSKLVLNSKNPCVRRDIGSPYDMHKTILRVGFSDTSKDDLGRVLFRVDKDPAGKLPPIVLVQSELEPAWETLPENYTATTPEWKTYDPQFQIGQKLRFRLRANPTKRVAAKNERLGSTDEGKRIGLLTEPDQLKWFLGKAEQGGFRVLRHNEPHDDPKNPVFNIQTVPEGRVWNGKFGYGGWFLSVRFEGVLLVTDPTAFRTLIGAGIGSAKGYGFGLLSVASA